MNSNGEGNFCNVIFTGFVASIFLLLCVILAWTCYAVKFLYEILERKRAKFVKELYYKEIKAILEAEKVVKHASSQPPKPNNQCRRQRQSILRSRTCLCADSSKAKTLSLATAV